MGEFGPGEDSERIRREIAERCLTEVDHLNRLRVDGRHEPATLEAVHINLLTAVKEMAMPQAVSTTHQEFRNGSFWWLDQNPIDVAASGYKYHKAEAALARVDIEVAEAEDVISSLRPGYIKVFISPKMTRKDAPLEIAKQEHLADDDMLRIHMLDMDEEQQVRGKFMQSVLVRDIDLSVWVRMLRDPNNIFGRAFDIEDEDSALSVMGLHGQLELPEAALPEGVVSLIRAALPYMDIETRRKTEAKLLVYADAQGQQELDSKAELIAARWTAFEEALADSLYTKRATAEIEQFVFSLQHQWGNRMLGLVARHSLPSGGLVMTRELAVELERAKQNVLGVSAAVIAGNEQVITRLGDQKAKEIYDREMNIQIMMASGYSRQSLFILEAHNNRAIAASRVHVEGGCGGGGAGDFGLNSRGGSGDFVGGGGGPETRVASSEGSSWSWTAGFCRIEGCPTLPRKTKVGPCAVCFKCQNYYDAGLDPRKLYTRPRPPKKASRATLTSFLLDKSTSAK